MQLCPLAEILLSGGDLVLNWFETKGPAVGSSLVLKTGSRLETKGTFTFYYGADIKVFDDGEFIVGSGYANAGLQIRCKKRISIGDRAAIAKDVVIMDSDAHEIGYEGHVMTKGVCIEEDVWIGTRAMILKGVTVGRGAVIAAGAVVTGDVAPHSVVAGVPARTIRKDITHGR
jgi:acetyltransferase-like isoleucine patch superfamily enzyme